MDPSKTIEKGPGRLQTSGPLTFQIRSNQTNKGKHWYVSPEVLGLSPGPVKFFFFKPSQVNFDIALTDKVSKMLKLPAVASSNSVSIFPVGESVQHDTEGREDIAESGGCWRGH